MTPPFYLVWPLIQLLMWIAEVSLEDPVSVGLVLVGVFCKLLCLSVCFLCSV